MPPKTPRLGRPPGSSSVATRDRIIDVARRCFADHGYEALIDLFTQGAAIKRPNKVSEIAAVAVLLASNAGRSITGTRFPVDGGTMPN